MIQIFLSKKYNATLEEIKIENGYEFVRAAEEEVILNLNETTKIISTGGSAVYSKKSMEHLKTFSSIIYNKTPIDIIIKRIDIGQERGLAVPAGMSILMFTLKENLCIKNIMTSFWMDLKQSNNLLMK